MRRIVGATVADSGCLRRFWFGSASSESVRQGRGWHRKPVSARRLACTRACNPVYPPHLHRNLLTYKQ
jgi:hypothetical protein